jgi:hypothetical protein
MMRRLGLVSLLVGTPWLFFSSNGFWVETDQQHSDSTIENAVRLHVEVERQSYCHVDDESFVA